MDSSRINCIGTEKITLNQSFGEYPVHQPSHACTHAPHLLEVIVKNDKPLFFFVVLAHSGKAHLVPVPSMTTKTFNNGGLTSAETRRLGQLVCTVPLLLYFTVLMLVWVQSHLVSPVGSITGRRECPSPMVV